MKFSCFGAVCCVVMFIEDVIAYYDRPIIGVAVQSSLHTDYLKYGDTFLLSSYVKYLQMAGARVVPVITNQSEEYYEDIFHNLNGVLFPGGRANLESSGYAHVGEKFYQMAIQAFDNGDYFPLWGTCNGFELLATMTAAKPVMSSCDGENLTLPLNFSSDFRSSRMFSDISDELAEAAVSQAITQNNHEYCLTAQTYSENSPLKQFYRVISTNRDRKGLQFISAIEGVRYPFYAVQFHPEKNLFNWEVTLNVSHTKTAVRFAQYLADFFVQEARKSNHHYPSSAAEGDALIDNYHSNFIGSPDFHNVYGFNLTREDVVPVNFLYIEISPHLCYCLQVIGGSLFLICGMLLMLLWANSLYLSKYHRRRQQKISSCLSKDVNLLVDVAESKPGKDVPLM